MSYSLTTYLTAFRFFAESWRPEALANGHLHLQEAQLSRWGV